MPVSRLLIVFSLAMLLGTSVGAQPLFYRVETLDWMAASSAAIVRGTVADFTRDVDRHGNTWNTVMIKVRETLKGRDRPFHTFAMENRVHKEDLPRWMKSGQELLIFLTDSSQLEPRAGKESRERFLSYKLTPRYVSQGRQALIEMGVPGKPRSLGYGYTLDLRSLTEPEEVLRYTRDAIAATDGLMPLRAQTIRWPKGTVNIDRIVPVDERLERLARRWIESEDAHLREEGAKAFAHYPSDESVSALVRLLEDPFFVTHTRREGDRRIETRREYPVRKVAFASLKTLGIEAPEPVILEPVPEEEE